MAVTVHSLGLLGCLESQAMMGSKESRAPQVSEDTWVPLDPRVPLAFLALQAPPVYLACKVSEGYQDCPGRKESRVRQVFRDTLDQEALQECRE